METDTEKLLKECDAGTKTAVGSIREVIDKAKSEELQRLLKECLETHEKLGNDIHAMLHDAGESGKDPHIMAKTMSKMKIDMKMMMENTDHTIAELMMDGCNMGIQKLSEYMNRYTAAEKDAQDLAARLIDAEQAFMDKLRMFL